MTSRSEQLGRDLAGCWRTIQLCLRTRPAFVALLAGAASVTCGLTSRDAPHDGVSESSGGSSGTGSGGFGPSEGGSRTGGGGMDFGGAPTGGGAAAGAPSDFVYRACSWDADPETTVLSAWNPTTCECIRVRLERRDDCPPYGEWKGEYCATGHRSDEPRDCENRLTPLTESAELQVSEDEFDALEDGAPIYAYYAGPGEPPFEGLEPFGVLDKSTVTRR